MRVRLSNQQDEVRVPVRPLQRLLDLAPPLLPRPLHPALTKIEVILVSRATMKKVHADFLGDATETDVITFPYGEILMCPAVAQEQAAAYGQPVEREILLYALHGLLHLVGYDDVTPAKARRMQKAQAAFLERVLAAR